VIVSRSHRFAERRRVTRKEIASEPLAIYSRRDYPDYQKLLRSALGVPAGKLRVVEECEGAFSPITAIEASRAVAVSARSILSVTGTRIVLIPLHPPPPTLKVGVCFPHAGEVPTAVNQFIGTARRVINQL
jgi:DNA-binding transcriptional LysR family regulator